MNIPFLRPALDHDPEYLDKIRDNLENLKKELLQSQSTLETGYLDTTILMLEDPTVKERVTEKIEQSYLNIEWMKTLEKAEEIIKITGNVF